MIYPYEGCCSAKGFERVCSLAAYEADSSFSCPECGKPLNRVITAPRYLNNTKPFEAFISPVDRTVINSQRELREHNKRNNVVNTHDGYDEKAILGFTKKDWQKPLDDERRADLQEDMKLAVQRLEHGYKPAPSTEGITPNE